MCSTVQYPQVMGFPSARYQSSLPHPPAPFVCVSVWNVLQIQVLWSHVVSKTSFDLVPHGLKCTLHLSHEHQIQMETQKACRAVSGAFSDRLSSAGPFLSQIFSLNFTQIHPSPTNSKFMKSRFETEWGQLLVSVSNPWAVYSIVVQSDPLSIFVFHFLGFQNVFFSRVLFQNCFVLSRHLLCCLNTL